MIDRHLCHVTRNTRIRGWFALDEKTILFNVGITVIADRDNVTDQMIKYGR